MLLNTLGKAKIAATTRKRHTTRDEILGVFNHRNVQLAFYDTPGFIRHADALKQDTKTLRNSSVQSATKADVVLLVVDAVKEFREVEQDTFAELTRIALDNAKLEVILLLNKVDLVVPKVRLLEITRKVVSLINGVKLGPEGATNAMLDTTTFMISALHNDGVIDLKNYLISIATFKPWVLPREQGPTDLTSEERVEEMILEMMLENTHEEIPYIADISCRSIKDLTKARIRIDVDIKVDTNSQMRIVIGQQGRTLVKVRQAAVEVLEKIFKKQVILYLWVGLRSKNDASSSSSSSDDDTSTSVSLSSSSN